MLKLDLHLNKDGTWTIYNPIGHYRTAKTLHDLPEQVARTIADYAGALARRVESFIPAPPPTLNIEESYNAL